MIPDQHTKYFQLSVNIFLMMIGFILSLVLLLLGIRLFFGLLSYIPWITYIYILGILLVPASLFISVFLIYARRTRRHPSMPVRTISYIFFALALISWIICLYFDLRLFFKKTHTDIGYYYSYNMVFLASNVTLIFLTGIMQALTTEKEKDWMER